MRAKHTLGPWIVGSHGCSIYGDDGNCVAMMRYTNGDKNDDLRLFADTNLIAAAPDLFEALQHIAKFDNDGLGEIGYQLARAAIAKAEGRS